jgi:protein-disulfide isomerase
VRSARTARSRGRFFAALAVVAVVGIGAIYYVSTQNKPVATKVDPNLPPSTAEGHFRGDPNAPVQILEFADFECPGCAQFANITEPDVRQRLIDSGKANYRYFDFPLTQHRNSVAASNAAACAEEQGKWWEMHDKLFAGQDEWNTQATSNPKKIFARYASELGLNGSQWESCFDVAKYQRNIDANQAEGVRRSVGQTPTFIIGDRMMPGALTYDEFKALVDSAAAKAPAAATAAAPATDSAKKP